MPSFPKHLIWLSDIATAIIHQEVTARAKRLSLLRSTPLPLPYGIHIQQATGVLNTMDGAVSNVVLPLQAARKCWRCYWHESASHKDQRCLLYSTTSLL